MEQFCPWSAWRIRSRLSTLPRPGRAVFLGRHGEHHLQEVGGVVEVVVRIDVWLMDSVLVSPGDHGRGLGDQPPGADVDRSLVRRVEGIRVVGGQRRGRRGQDLHRVRRVGERLEEVLHVFPEQGVAGDGLDELLVLILGGELAVLEQVSDLQEGGLLRQLLDRVAPIGENALFAIDETDRGASPRRCWRSRGRWSRARVRRAAWRCRLRSPRRCL